MIEVLLADAEKINVDRCIALAALSVSIISIFWQFHTWKHQKKREGTPLLKAFIMNTPLNVGGHQTVESYFVVKNIGQCGVTILDCEINGKPITKFEELIDSDVIIGAMLPPQEGIIQCPRFPLMNTENQVKIGSPVKLTCKADSGKKFYIKISLGKDVL